MAWTANAKLQRFINVMLTAPGLVPADGWAAKAKLQHFDFKMQTAGHETTASTLPEHL